MGPCMVGELMSDNHAIEISGLTVSYKNSPVIHNLSGLFTLGTMTAIIGPNGGGKSTLLNTLMGFTKHTTGTIDYKVDRKNMAYLPQTSEIDRSFPLTVHNVIELGLCQHVGFYQDLTSIPSPLEKIICTMGLTEVLYNPLDTLSGGQFQRVLFARLAMQQASLIILDEPFSAIDAATVADLMDVILKWHRKGRTIIMVTHDLDLVRQYFPQTLILAGECIAWGNTADVLTSHNLQKMQSSYNDYCFKLYCPNNTSLLPS